jgi:hypothetical protein
MRILRIVIAALVLALAAMLAVFTSPAEASDRFYTIDRPFSYCERLENNKSFTERFWCHTVAYPPDLNYAVARCYRVKKNGVDFITVNCH